MSEIEALAVKVRGLSTPDKLRLAAGLLEANKLSLARRVVDMAETEMTAIEIIVADEKREGR